MIGFVIDSFSILVWGIVFHELGHVLYFKTALNRRVGVLFNTKTLDVVVGKDEDYCGLKKKQLLCLYLSGILLGAAAMTLFALFRGRIFFMYLIPYFLGCKNDLMRLRNG